MITIKYLFFGSLQSLLHLFCQLFYHNYFSTIILPISLPQLVHCNYHSLPQLFCRQYTPILYVNPVMVTAALQRSYFFDSSSGSAAALFRHQRKAVVLVFFSRKSGSALAPYFKHLPLRLLLIHSSQDFFDSNFHTLPVGISSLRFFSLCSCYHLILV